MAFVKNLFDKNFIEYASYVIRDRAIPDLEDGLKRAKSATIPNAIRQNVETACVKAGHCVNCSAAGDDDSMCRAILILEEAVKGRKYHVIIVGEDLGY